MYLVWRPFHQSSVAQVRLPPASSMVASLGTGSWITVHGQPAAGPPHVLIWYASCRAGGAAEKDQRSGVCQV